MALSVKKKPQPLSPTKFDPSGTKSIRTRFMRQVNQKMTELKRRIWDLIVTQDALGLVKNPIRNTRWKSPIGNTRWKFNTTVQQLDLFRQWIIEQMTNLFYGLDEDSWWRAYINEGWQLGQNKIWQAWKDPSKFLLANPTAFNSPVSLEKVKLLASRVLTELKNVTSDMATAMSRTLVDGLIQGQSPREVARLMNKAVEGVNKKRALVIARTETVRAHAEGQLEALEKYGMTEVGVAVEWTVSGMGQTRKKNPSPCPLCAPMKGVVFSVEEAHGMIPRHPNCMCSFVPANIGEDKSQQTRTFKRINEALRASLKAGAPKASKSNLASYAKKSNWAGAMAKINKKRPADILED